MNLSVDNISVNSVQELFVGGPDVRAAINVLWDMRVLCITGCVLQ